MKQRNWIKGLVFACLFVAVEPVLASEEGKAEDGWVKLFNGKDLTGWKKHPDDKGQMGGRGRAGWSPQWPVLPGNLHQGFRLGTRFAISWSNQMNGSRRK